MTIEWKCPRCEAKLNQHGKGECDSPGEPCGGLVCGCDEDEYREDHGITFTDPCVHACCYHCGWEGLMPPKIKGLQAWEKKALEAGWTPPAKRAAELGMGAK